MNYQVLIGIAIFLLTILAQIKNADAVWVCLSTCFVVIVCLLFVDDQTCVQKRAVKLN